MLDIHTMNSYLATAKDKIIKYSGTPIGPGNYPIKSESLIPHVLPYTILTSDLKKYQERRTGRVIDFLCHGGQMRNTGGRMGQSGGDEQGSGGNPV